jgi:hypothetical protein
MKHESITILRIFAAAGLLASSGLWAPLAFAAAGGTPQASITLKNSNVGFCNKQENAWTLTKTNDATGRLPSGTLVTWTVTATKTPGARTICADGYLEVTNTGSADATVGNIVVNLQGQTGGKKSIWASLAADVANSTAGDAATSANIVAAASAEIVSGGSNISGNYSVSGTKGTFTETPASGPLEFTDANNNTLFSLSPAMTIAPGATVQLKYSAQFNLAVAPGTPLRVEAIVTFGNSGLRGGSGASAANIDINGNNSIDGDEANVRSVPSRITANAPGVEQCNDTVTIADEMLLTGSAGQAPASPGDVLPSGTINATTTWIYKAVVTGDGSVTNDASLAGQSTTVSVSTGVDPVTSVPNLPVTFECCTASDADASSGVEVYTECPPEGCVPPPCTRGVNCPCPGPDCFAVRQYCSYSQGGFGGRGDPYKLLALAFEAKYPSGVSIGSTFTGTWTTASDVQAYLPGNGQAAAFTKNTIDATSTSAGVFGGQVLALRLNIDVLSNGIGGLYLVDTGTPYDGMTVSAILAEANKVIGTSSAPLGGLTINNLNDLVAFLNLSFHECTEVSSWAALHLTPNTPDITGDEL